MKHAKKNGTHIIPASLIWDAAATLKELRVNVDFMDVEFDYEKSEITVIDHDGNVVSSYRW